MYDEIISNILLPEKFSPANFINEHEYNANTTSVKADQVKHVPRLMKYALNLLNTAQTNNTGSSMKRPEIGTDRAANHSNLLKLQKLTDKQQAYNMIFETLNDHLDTKSEYNAVKAVMGTLKTSEYFPRQHANPDASQRASLYKSNNNIRFDLERYLPIILALANKLREGTDVYKNLDGIGKIKHNSEEFKQMNNWFPTTRNVRNEGNVAGSTFSLDISRSLTHDGSEGNLKILRKQMIRHKKLNALYNHLNSTLINTQKMKFLKKMESRLLSFKNFIEGYFQAQNKTLYRSSKQVKDGEVNRYHEVAVREFPNISEIKMKKPSSQKKLMSFYDQHLAAKKDELSLKRRWNERINLLNKTVVSQRRPKYTAYSDTSSNRLKANDGFGVPSKLHNESLPFHLEILEKELDDLLKVIKDKQNILTQNNNNVSCDFEHERRIYHRLLRLIQKDNHGKVTIKKIQCDGFEF